MAGVAQLERTYAESRWLYHVLGKRAAAPNATARDHAAYEAAKREYHRAGDELRRAKNRSR